MFPLHWRRKYLFQFFGDKNLTLSSTLLNFLPKKQVLVEIWKQSSLGSCISEEARRMWRQNDAPYILFSAFENITFPYVTLPYRL